MSPVLEAPTVGQIQWTAWTDIEGSSEPTDPLRFDMYAQRLGNVLLPGITNRTDRLRYLGMVCAGLHLTDRPRQTMRDHRQAFLPFERGWALAQTVSVGGALKEAGGALKSQFRGLRGVNRVLAHYRAVAEDASFAPTSYTLLKSQDAQGGLGVYLVTLRQFGFLQSDSVRPTATGHALAEAFLPRMYGARADQLLGASPVKRRDLERLGERLTLGTPSREEAATVKHWVFEDQASVVADCVARMRRARPDSSDPRELLDAIGDATGDRLERAARYAIDFDPLRVALLQLFARLGKQLEGRPGSTRLVDLAADELDSVATEARAAARRLAEHQEVIGMEPISTLARDLAAGTSTGDTVATMLRFHRQEGRTWLTADGHERYVVGRHGPFEEPDPSFNGYTVGRAMALLDDVEQAA